MKIVRRNASGTGLLLIAAAMLMLCLNGHARQAHPVPPTHFDDWGKPHPEAIDLNTADYWQLRCLPGINDEKARAILQCRAELGGFSSRDELLQAEGITEEILVSIWSQVVLDTDG